MGYSFGKARVRLPGGVVRDKWPAALFTAVPSRSFAPHGLLWDEGESNAGAWPRCGSYQALRSDDLMWTNLFWARHDRLGEAFAGPFP